jgi:hypothetical protein
VKKKAAKQTSAKTTPKTRRFDLERLRGAIEVVEASLASTGRTLSPDKKFEAIMLAYEMLKD